MTISKEDESFAAITKFEEEYQVEIERERIDRAKENVLTREILLGHIQETFKIVLGDGYVEVRARLSQKESDKFPDVAEILKGKTANEVKEELTKAQEKAMDKKIKIFMAYIIVNPALTSEQIDTHFSGPEQKSIITEFLISQAKGMSNEAVAFFRSKW